MVVNWLKDLCIYPHYCVTTNWQSLSKSLAHVPPAHTVPLLFRIGRAILMQLSWSFWIKTLACSFGSHWIKLRIAPLRLFRYILYRWKRLWMEGRPDPFSLLCRNQNRIQCPSYKEHMLSITRHSNNAHGIQTVIPNSGTLQLWYPSYHMSNKQNRFKNPVKFNPKY